MPERLAILRPPDLGLQFDAAVHDVYTAPIAIDVRSLTCITARLAIGDHQGIRELLRDASPAPLLPLVLARFTAWSGDLRTANDVWPRAVASIDDTAELDSATRAATCAEFQRLATDLGDAPFAARLLRLARENPGGPSADREHIAYNASAQFVCDAVFDTIGLDADAMRGRLRIRPRIDRYASLEVRDIRMGDATIDMEAAHEDGAIVIRLEQTAGSTPITALLEPVVRNASHTTVDGRVAELAPVPIDNAVIVPVQLVLDDVRTLVIHA